MIGTLNELFIERLLFYSVAFRFYTRWKDWESWYSQSFGLHFSLREEQWQEDWAFILSLASQVRMLQGMLLLWEEWGSWSKCLGLHEDHVGGSVAWREERLTWQQVTWVLVTAVYQLWDHRQVLAAAQGGQHVSYIKWLKNCPNKSCTWWF